MDKFKFEVGQMMRLTKPSIAHKVRLSPIAVTPFWLGYVPQIEMHVYSISSGEGFSTDSSFMFLGIDDSNQNMIDLGYARGIFLCGESVYLIYLRDFE